MGQTMTVQKREIKADERGGAQQRTSMVPAVYIERARKLFARSPKNPILRPEDMPFPCKAVCSPGACLVDGEAVLLLRVIDDLDHSHLHVAR